MHITYMERECAIIAMRMRSFPVLLAFIWEVSFHHHHHHPNLARPLAPQPQMQVREMSRALIRITSAARAAGRRARAATQRPSERAGGPEREGNASHAGANAT